MKDISFLPSRKYFIFDDKILKYDYGTNPHSHKASRYYYIKCLLIQI